MGKRILRSTVEAGFIIFLFYANLLMGEFTRTGKGQEMGMMWAVKDVCTMHNFVIALIAAFIGNIVLELLRKKY